MRLTRSRKAGLVALLSSAAVVLTATLVLQPAASAGVQPTSSAGIQPASEPDLASGPDAPADSTVVFRPTRDGGQAGVDSFSGGGDIHCTLVAFNPRVPALKPTKIEGFARVQCTGWIPVITVSVSLFRGDNRISTNTSTGTGTNFGTSTFGPCQGGAYYSTGSALLFAPPGYIPPQLLLLHVSGVSAINGAGTAVPPWICQQTSSPPPTPPPSGLPVINSLFCEYLGNNQHHCNLSASNWTQIRWFVNGSARTGWNNQTTVLGSCSGGTSVDARVSNANGTVERTSFVNCTGEAP